ncbi:hypothetical protein EH31_10910 [Erythrobacter longus]|uniref:Blue (type 1) copper domain-containing protein n=1 Tax=Erythrobacter longus TaxID=1044 RepID=A0A074MAA2_ERYLO|nr:plastocyanin/azurin family copper-binding protein [Erythrobacter longus]KEO89660.1 hypothetical protein EH31_10910 [Erythrobacter longus]
MQNRRQALGTIGTIGLGAFGVGFAVNPLTARNVFEVAMRNADPAAPSRRMVFTPDLLKVPAGSQVRFEAPEGAHNTQSTTGMLPNGAEGWRFGIRKSGTITLSQPGFYGYHCLPHRSVGMVGLIIVEGSGMMENLQAAKAVKHPAKAAQKWANLWERAEKLL